ncbi:MAG: ribonuclease HII [Oscillatoriaceae cyanobacterium]
MTIAGVDEVGRGCLFGPVVAAAVILPPPTGGDDVRAHLAAAGVKDSKRLSPGKRCRLAKLIGEMAVDCQVGIASVGEIDRLNILQASLLAMRRAILRLKTTPELCLIDGNQLIPHLSLPQETIVKGDAQCLDIACASIVAKVWRDQLISRLAVKYPHYDLTNNKGYGTAKHLHGIEIYGLSPQHRRSFRQDKNQVLLTSDKEQMTKNK